MRKSIACLGFFLAVFLLTPNAVHAQLGSDEEEEGEKVKMSKVRFGVRGGIDFMTLGGDVENVDRRIGFILGGFVVWDFNGPIALQPELAYIQKGASSEDSFDGTTVTTTTKLDYIEIPVLLKYQIPTGGGVSPSLFAGPILGFNVTAKVEAEGGGESETDDISDNVNSTDLGLAFGGGLDFSTSTGIVSIDLRYGLGLSNIASEGGDVNNQGFMVTAGLAF